MRFLLDTHALLWALSAPARLPLPIVTAIRNPSNAVYVSAASMWEIAIKKALGKLTADGRHRSFRRGGGLRGADGDDAPRSPGLRSATPPPNPFDRMLVAQAFEEGLTVVIRDPSFAAYRIPTAWG